MIADSDLADTGREQSGDDTPLKLVLLPAFADRQVASMNRYCVELLRGLRTRAEVEVGLAANGVGPDVSRLLPQRVARCGTRFIWYPKIASGLTGGAFHILDQGYAHLTPVLPSGRVIVTCHDLIPLRAYATDAPYAVPRLTRAWYRYTVSFLHKAAHVVCVSEATRRDAMRFASVKPERTSVVYSGVSEHFKPLSSDHRQRARLRFPEDAHLLLHVSSGAAYKNVEGTIEVLARLRGRALNTHLLRVGSALTVGQRELASRLGVSRQVIELGTVKDERLVELYNAADALILPSYWEGSGWPAAEALACGTPVVVSTADALVETVGDAGLMAPPTDADALAGAVHQLWESPTLRAALRERGFGRSQQFSWPVAVDAYLDLYKRVAAGASHPGPVC